MLGCRGTTMNLKPLHYLARANTVPVAKKNATIDDRLALLVIGFENFSYIICSLERSKVLGFTSYKIIYWVTYLHKISVLKILTNLFSLVITGQSIIKSSS